jgi:microcystin-dependent protein
MAQPFVGEIRLVGFNFQPNGWAFCNGQLIPISQNAALFDLLGTTYGGDGINTFALPNLQSRVPIHQGQALSGIVSVLGESAGTETVSLTENHLPFHSHVAVAGPGGDTVSPSNALWSTDPFGNTAAYTTVAPGSTMASDAILGAGGDAPHSNLQPFLAINYVISLFGVFPSQN